MILKRSIKPDIKSNLISSNIVIRMCAGLMSIILVFISAGCGKSRLEVETVVESTGQADEPLEPSESLVASKSTVEEQSETQDINIESASAGDSQSITTICVYVCGAVAQEGVYELPNGSRLADALEAAGGYAENAVHGYLNLAEPLVDGERIYFPYLDEEETLDMASGAESDLKSDFKSKSDTKSINGLVNINTASIDELKTLSGIGDSRAEDIVAYREANGSFSSIEDIKNVSGIGESIFSKIKPYITVE